MTKHKEKPKKGKKKFLNLKKILLFTAVLIILLVVAINYLVSSLFGVSIITLGKDALIIAGVGVPTVKEITETPTEEVNENVQEFIDVFNEAGDPPELVSLEEGITGMRVINDEGEIVEELTLTVVNGEIIDIDYSGIDPSIKEENIAEIPENFFRVIFGGELPKSLPGVLEAYSKSKSGDFGE